MIESNCRAVAHSALVADLPICDVAARAPSGNSMVAAVGETAETTWPHLDDLALGQDARLARATGIGGSDANTVLSEDRDRILRLWREKRGEVEPEDLSSRLPVMLGSWTEAFNRQWYQRETGYLVVDDGKVFESEVHSWRRCTIDGFVPLLGAVWEAKHTSAFAKADEVVARYMPQLQHNMAVTGMSRAALSVIFGNSKWEVFDIASDWLYQEELLIAESRFWDCVRSGEPPVPAVAPPPPKPVGVREVCFEGNNAWASAAVDWRTHRDAAKAHAVAASAIKGLIDDDVARAFGHGIEAKRSKAGALAIREYGA